MLAPMARNIDAAAEPDLVVLPGMIDKPLEGTNVPWPPDQAAMQAHRHHPRDSSALRVERIEAVTQIGEELIA